MAEARDAVDQMTWEAGGGGQRYKLTGRLAMLEGDIETAQSLLEQAHAQLGPDRQVANALVQIYLRKNLPGKAEQIIDSLRRDPALSRDPRILLAKAQLELRYGNMDESQRYLAQVLRANPAAMVANADDQL